MFVIIGYVLVFASVIGGFLMAGGHVAALIQPAELVIIGGAAVGAFVVSNSPKTIKAVFRGMPGIFKGSKFTKQLYIDLLSMLYDMLSKCRKEGLMSIETDIDAPNDSKLFAKHPTILADHHAMEFVCDYMRLLVGGSMNAMQVENLMDIEIETHHHEAEQVPHAIARLADGLPAFGIVAADGGGSYNGVGWAAAGRTWEAYRCRPGGNLHRHPSVLWVGITNSGLADPQGRRVHKNASMHQSGVAGKHA